MRISSPEKIRYKTRGKKRYFFTFVWYRQSIRSLRDNDVQTFLGEDENQNTERKTESYIFSGFGNGISRG